MSKYNVGLKTLVLQGLSEPEFYGDLVYSPVPIDCWNTGSNSDASSFKHLGCSSSGPKAFDGFKPVRSFVTPSAET